METELTDSSASQYLTFVLGAEEFALDIRCVREIIQFSRMTAVPLMPEFVRGVINLRGAVVPVIDLQRRFGRARATIGKKTCIIIFETQHDQRDGVLGLMVDAVSEVLDIARSHIEPTPDFGTTIHKDFIQGMGKVADDFIIILNPERAMDIEDMAAEAEQTTA